MTQPNTNTFSPVTSSSLRPSIPTLSKGSSIAVIGAGAFGTWSALFLQQAGFNVTLLDTWGPGNARSSSGDETRVIRSTYGHNEFYFDLNVRALSLWKKYERILNQKLFHNTGVLWLCYDENTPLVDGSIPFAQKHNMPYEYLRPNEIQKRYPVVRVNDLHHAFFDPFGGYLKARESCYQVQQLFCKEGGEYKQVHVTPGRIQSAAMENIILSDGTTVQADIFLFACGSWLGKLFPEVLGNIITCSRQEVYYFGVPQNLSKDFENFPTWVDVDGQDFYYGIPSNAFKGFKVGVDKRGKSFDPSVDDHVLDPAVLLSARKFLSHRFPSLTDAPLLENRVCPYENSPDGNFIFDRHPHAENVLFLGGGSGHGFKHAPALGDLVMKAITGKEPAPGNLSLSKSAN